jgi:glycosyltransferase involved in cell wall biosynthesis
MFFEKPIIAFDSCAVPYTLGGSGALIKDKDPVFVSLLIDRIVKDARLRKEIVESQNERLKDFSYKKVRETFVSQLKEFIKG